MKLGKLASLEKVEIENERAELLSTIENIMEILNSRDKQIAMLRERIDTLLKNMATIELLNQRRLLLRRNRKSLLQLSLKIA